MEGDADKEERLLDIVDELAMIGAAFPWGLADMLWEEFWVGLEDIWAVGRLGRPPGPTRGCWRAKPGCICSRDELAADPKIEFDDAKIGEEATEATGKLPGAAGETRVFKRNLGLIEMNESLLRTLHRLLSGFAP